MTRGAFLLAALALAGPAEAGVHAIYALDGEAQPLIVEVADNGDASFMQVDGEVRVIVSGGHAFAVGDGDDGPMVARFVDVAQALGRTGAPALDMEPGDAETLAPLKQDVPVDAAPIGARAVAGVAGTAYRLTTGPGSRVQGTDAFVATDDAALRPIGRAIEVILAEGSGIVALFDRIGPDAARWMRVFGRLAALGMPLEMEGLYVLRSVETRRIPPETIALPGPPIGPEAIAARIRALSPGI